MDSMIKRAQMEVQLFVIVGFAGLLLIIAWQNHELGDAINIAKNCQANYMSHLEGDRVWLDHTSQNQQD